MKNFNFKKAFEALAVIATFVIMFTLIYAILPLWVYWIAFTAFILLCFYLAGREEPHYWAYFVFRRNGNNTMGVFITDGDFVTFPENAVEDYAQLTGLSIFEIGEGYYKAMRKAILKENEKDINNDTDNDTDTDNQR